MLLNQYQFCTLPSFTNQVKWDALLHLLPCFEALYVRPLYSNVMNVLKVNYKNSNVLSSAKHSVKSETSYEAVILGWLVGL
jgi:hypothetical protein